MTLRLPTFLAAVAALPILAVSMPSKAEPASILGHYRITGGAVLAIADCGDGRICGRIVVPSTPDKRAQSASPPLACGLTVLTELHPQVQGEGWQGRFHDPVIGDYTLNLWQNATLGEALLTQRYNGPPFLTRSMPHTDIWVRVPPPAAACNAVTPTS